MALPGDDSAEAKRVPVREYPPPADDPAKGWVLALATVHDWQDRSLESARISDLASE